MVASHPHAIATVAIAPADTQFHHWFIQEGAWWATSFVFHMLLMCALMLLSNKATLREPNGSLAFIPVDERQPDEKTLDIERLKPDEQKPDLDAREDFDEKQIDLTPTTVDYRIESTVKDKSPPGTESVRAPGGKGDPMVFLPSSPGPGPRHPTSLTPGSPDGNDGYIGRPGRPGHHGPSVPQPAQRSIAYALNWLARHQMYDGHWSLHDYARRCTDASCSGPGNHKTDAGATALALLPFLAAGQTHETKGPYKANIFNGLFWLIKNQKADGDLSGACSQRMYTQGLATICLCEAYGMSHDRAIGAAAQRAVNFIQAAQNTTTGGWRYEPGDPGDTSVVGWQVMALKSAQMAYLDVDPAVLERAKKWLESCASGDYKGHFSYQPGGGSSDTMTSVGLLCTQYLGAHREDGSLREGKDFLLAHLPDDGSRNLYYWYYASQVMHNLVGPDWDTWHRKMRKILIETQCKDGSVCALGSWDPDRPSRDQWGANGGRIMVTSLATLTLEVPYRYLPLYKLDNEAALAGK